VADRVVVEVVSVEPFPLGASGSRRAVVRWSDGSVGEALRWWDDELLFCEGDLLGKTEAQLRSLHFGSVGEALRWWDDLCGCPHKSSYAVSGVMPTWAWRPSRRAVAVGGCSA
jgi:hypothetical protein